MAATRFLASHFGLPGACAGLLADNQELASAKNDKGQSPAHLAADAETTQALLAGAGDRLSDLLAPDAEGKSPMFFAKSPEQAQALVGAGDKIHATDALGNTPLHGAATALFVGFLLDNKADPFAKNKAGQSPLHTLDGPALKALLDDAAERKEFVKERDLRDAEGFAPVARAALRGDNENVKVLVIDRLAEPRDLLTDNVFEGLDPEQRKSIAGFAVAVVQVGGEKKVLEIADGERIVFMQKVVKGKGKGKKELASKSELGSVIDVQKLPDGHLKMLVMVDGKKGPPIEISTKDAEVEHGYAITVHKSQGATVDSCRYLYSQFTSSELAYVALSRHRQTCEVYAEAEHRESMALKMGRKIAKVETLDLLTEAQRQGLESANEKALGASLFEKVLKKITFKEDLAAKIKKEGEEFYQKLIRPVRYTEAALEKVRAEPREIYKNLADALNAPKCQERLKELRAAVALAKVERARNKEDAKFIASDLADSEERLKRPTHGLTSNEAMDVLEALDVLKEIRKGEGKDNWRPEIQDTKPGAKASGVVLAANDKYVFLSSIGFRQGLEGMGQNVGGMAFKRVPLAGEKAKAFRQDPSQLKRQIGRAATFELDAKGELAASSITASAEEAKRAELARARAQGQGYGLGR